MNKPANTQSYKNDTETENVTEVRILQSLSEVTPDMWNTCVNRDAPFLRHEFLHALETSGCVGESQSRGDHHTGWQPQHLVVMGDNNKTLLGALPAYLKYHSYGEYVFDWSWADAYRRAGLKYYPKLLVAIPFTPVTGPRILVHPEGDYEDIARTLLSATTLLAEKFDLSSIHINFSTEDENRFICDNGFLQRQGVQFHWHNNGYSAFDDFLTTFSSKKRKNVKRERRQVVEAGVSYEWLRGDEVSDELWQTYYGFYRSTIDVRGASAYLNGKFFKTLGATMPDVVRLLIARRNNVPVAGALFLQGSNALYGRYWGASEWIDGLHFETCYYQAIEYCIKHNIQRFEAGAQGEHKIKRGLLPVKTFSAHWLAQAQFQHAIAKFLHVEGEDMQRYNKALHTHSPYKTAD